MELILVLFMFFWGLFMVLFPDVVWQIQHFLNVRGGEPTSFYLIVTRIAGVCCMLMAIVCGVMLFSV